MLQVQVRVLEIDLSMPFYGSCLRLYVCLLLFILCVFLSEFWSNCWFGLYECESKDGQTEEGAEWTGR